jgi:hypothetical protein
MPPSARRPRPTRPARPRPATHSSATEKKWAASQAREQQRGPSAESGENRHHAASTARPSRGTRYCMCSAPSPIGKNRCAPCRRRVLAGGRGRPRPRLYFKRPAHRGVAGVGRQDLQRAQRPRQLHVVLVRGGRAQQRRRRQPRRLCAPPGIPVTKRPNPAPRACRSPTVGPGQGGRPRPRCANTHTNACIQWVNHAAEPAMTSPRRTPPSPEARAPSPSARKAARLKSTPDPPATNGAAAAPSSLTAPAGQKPENARLPRPRNPHRRRRPR